MLLDKWNDIYARSSCRLGCLGGASPHRTSVMMRWLGLNSICWALWRCERNSASLFCLFLSTNLCGVMMVALGDLCIARVSGCSQDLTDDPGWGWIRMLPHFTQHERYHGGRTAYHSGHGPWSVSRQRLTWKALDVFRQV